LRKILTGLYGAIALMIAIASTVTAMFYLLDALQGERRDRSVLFWKSLPVSDTTAVLTKLFTAMAIAPAIAFAVIIVTQLVVIVLSSIGLLFAGANPAPLWTNLPIFFQVTVVVIYSLIVISLWFAPIYGWLLVVSSWAKRSTFLWAVLPPVALSVLEKVLLRTEYVGDFIAERLFGLYRLLGGRIGQSADDMSDAQVRDSFLKLRDLDVAGSLQDFYTSPELWLGVLAAALLLAAAMWVRRYRDENS